jgi:hypothetical protein
MFLPVYENLVNQYNIKLKQDSNETFLDKWYSAHIRNEIDFVFEEIKKIKNIGTKKIVSVILSRTIRSCRATTHADLATLLEPITTTYYCHKHGKMCKPLFSILKWWKTYTKDTIARLQYFDKLRTNTFQLCLTGDSRNIDIFKEIKKKNVFLVANDKYNMYPTIAENTGMKIVNQFKQPVLNRTENDKTAYSESIFHLKDNKVIKDKIVHIDVNDHK